MIRYAAPKLTSKERLDQTTTLLFVPSISRLVEISEVGDKRRLRCPLLFRFHPHGTHGA